ncbi:hypothetical protein NLG97_g7972 [Lecanicillium saksenae]|uniref:Uncharacterized protein n=1 Tax=Lecanicillium saksenae TaxID=468837 RepID=A0ACC1QLF0_9HYPO|nr:hypothetical protein NLG97_g7972 [Lecanicillium saksenae]
MYNKIRYAHLACILPYPHKVDNVIPQFMVNISTKAIHDFEAAGMHPNFSASKSEGTILVQQIATSLSPEGRQVLIFHPGAIFTPSARRQRRQATPPTPSHGIRRKFTENLSDYYAVLAASDEEKFLRGRFTWAAWDVDEISNGEIRERIETNGNYLKIGVVGI